MSHKEIKQIFKRLERIEKRIFSKSIAPNQNKKELKTNGNTSLSSLILKLRNSGFFKQPQSANDVYKKLSPTYSCKINRVNMALKRLRERKKLRIADKIIKGRKILTYVW
ncbi:MAG: hypothetical protein WC705_03075 [Candidatus Paceibacterota bacterium]|jgi:hypothetical protein